MSVLNTSATFVRMGSKIVAAIDAADTRQAVYIAIRPSARAIS
jgi:hypothetical protein